MSRPARNWDSYRRKSVIIEKAVANPDVYSLMRLHYSVLHGMLVKGRDDEDVFNDAYLKLTRSYDPDVGFVDQFRYCFHFLKGAYHKDDLAAKYAVTLDNGKDGTIPPSVDMPACGNCPGTGTGIGKLKSMILEYANDKKGKNAASQEGGQGGKGRDLLKREMEGTAPCQAQEPAAL